MNSNPKRFANSSAAPYVPIVYILKKVFVSSSNVFPSQIFQTESTCSHNFFHCVKFSDQIAPLASYEAQLDFAKFSELPKMPKEFLMFF